VLDYQRRTSEPLADDERAHCAVLDTAGIAEWKRAADCLARRLGAAA